MGNICGGANNANANATTIPPATAVKAVEPIRKASIAGGAATVDIVPSRKASIAAGPVSSQEMNTTMASNSK